MTNAKDIFYDVSSNKEVIHTAKKKYFKKSNVNNAMVLTFLVALGLGFIGGYTAAKLRYIAKIGVISEMVAAKDRTIGALKTKDNRVFLKDNRMMVAKDGVTSFMTSNTTLSDGTTVTLKGEYQKPDGTKGTLKEGQWMDMNGVIYPGAPGVSL